MTLIRRSLQVIAIVVALIVGATAMAVIVTQTTWFKEWLRAFIVRQAADYVNGRLSIGRLDGNLLFGVELEDVRITMDDQPVVEIEDVGLDYNIFTFLAGHVVLDDIRVNQLVIRAQRTADGWNITQIVRARTADSPRRRLPIEIGEIGVSDATIVVDEPAEERAVGTAGAMVVPARIGRLDASVGVTSNEDALTIDLAHVSLRADEPYLGINARSGVIRRTDEGVTLENLALRTEESSLSVDGVIATPDEGPRTVDLRISSDKFVIDEIARVVPALGGYALQPAFEIDASGPLEALSVDLNARDATLGTVTGTLTVDLVGPDRRIAGTTSLGHFNVAPLLREPVGRRATFASDVTGEARIDVILPAAGRPLRGTYVLNAGHAAFAGYEARDVVARGRIDGTVIRVDGAANAYGGRATAAGTIAFGRPVTVALTGRAAAIDLRNLPPVFRAPGVPSELQFAYTLEGRGTEFAADLQFDASTLAGASIAPGTTAQARFGGGAPAYAAEGRVANLDLQQLGHGFGIRALAADRFRSRVTATFDVSGRGGGRYPLVLDATGTVADSELFGATFPRLEMTAHFSGGDARVSAAGEFAGLNPAVVTGNERVAGDVSGAMDVETTLREYVSGVTVDSFEATGRVNLVDSDVAGLDIDFAAVDGSYRNREGQLATLEVAGPDLTARAQGTIALNDTGASNLKAHIETPSLEPIAWILDRPLRGAAIVDATVTGNARELTVDGALQGSNIGYGRNAALTLSSAFTVSVPELTPELATVRAKSAATFVEIGGQTVNELAAETTYSQSKLDFNAVAQHGMRQLAASGGAVLHPDHQEVHLADFALRAEQVEWRTAPGTEAAIRYGDDRLAIADLRLVSGDQRIDADGVLGSPGEVLLVRAENVELAGLDTDVRVTGEVRAPRVEGFVEVEAGTVDVARVLEQATADPYATEAATLDEARPAADTPAAALPQPRILDALDLTLGVSVPGNLVLRGNDLRPANAPIDIGDMNVTVGGAMQIRKGPWERPRLVGEVNTIRGNYTFQGRRFDIMRDGRIRFDGSDEIDPLVDLRARRIISGVETIVRVQGTMRQPELSFSSRPPLDQADILSLIVFNVPVNQLGEGQQVSLAEYAGALAGGYLVSGLTRSIAEALELDEFEIQTEGERGLGPTLSIGEQVGERLFFRIRQGFGAEEATEFILEYQIAEFLRLQGAVAETTGGTQRVTFRRIERGGLDLIFFFSY